MNHQQEKRYEKIFNEELYQIDFKKSSTYSTFVISGSTKNVYDVHLKNKKFECNCPDSKTWSRKHNVVCKHICFVLFRISKLFVKQDDSIYFKPQNKLTFFFDRLELSDNEKEYLEEFINQRQFGNDVFNEELKQKYQYRISNPSTSLFNESKKLIEDNDECPICYDILLNEQMNKDQLLSCPDCKNYVHPKCMEKWLQYNPSCVYCRSDVWSKLNEKGNKKYVNLG